VTLFSLVSIAALVYAALYAHPPTTRVVAGLGAAMTLSNPVAGAGIGVVWFSLKRRRMLRARRLARERAEGEIELLTHSMLIGLSGGLAPAAALALSREALRSALGDDVDLILRRNR